jgi:site-specific DNA-methyltransferase (adenine-specific)
MKETRDILTLFEALSSYEVFTPPRVARSMLDLLPADVWSKPEYKFLDPATKSGVFLREIFYRLYDGLDTKGKFRADDGVTYDLDDPQERINHILKNMIYGVSISELTGYVARRTLYGVMEANTDKPTAVLESFMKSSNYEEWSEEEQLKFVDRNKFNDYYDPKIFQTKEHVGLEAEGNIFYPSDEVAKKVLEDGVLEVEDTYFPFINDETKHKKILDIKEDRMKFDVIIGNPPYQVSDGSGKGAGAIPVYNHFIEISKNLNPKYLSMITPSRWFTGGRGLDSFRKKELQDWRLKEIHDFPNAKDCFPGVEIKGGVNFFLWEYNYNDDCNVVTYSNGKEISRLKRPLLEENSDVFIRDNKAVNIYRKVIQLKEKSINNIISSAKPFGLRTYFMGEDKKMSNGVKVYRNKGIGYIKKSDITYNNEWIDNHKVIAPYAVGSGDVKSDIIKPIYSEPGSCCSETYIVFGPTNTKEEAKNIIGYIKTKFFHFMVSIKKNTQHATKKAYQFVPLQDFSKAWTDQELYKKYDLTKDEIDYIETNVPHKVRD